MVGDEKSDKPIRPGARRSDVLARLGTPEHFLSEDQMTYSLLTERAVWVYPLFLSDGPAQFRAYVLRLTSDDGTLIRWEMAHADEDRDPVWFGYETKAPQRAKEFLDDPKKVKTATLSPKG